MNTLTSNQKLSLLITSENLNGSDIKIAIDKVLGNATFEKLAFDLYDQLKINA